MYQQILPLRPRSQSLLVSVDVTADSSHRRFRAAGHHRERSGLGGKKRVCKAIQTGGGAFYLATRDFNQGVELYVNITAGICFEHAPSPSTRPQHRAATFTPVKLLSPTSSAGSGWNRLKTPKKHTIGGHLCITGNKNTCQAVRNRSDGCVVRASPGSLGSSSPHAVSHSHGYKTAALSHRFSVSLI